MNHEKFLARRRTGIGGSDIGAIVGVDPFRTPMDVFLEKTGRAEEESSPVMERGTRLEPIVLELYTERTGHKLKKAKFRRHREHSFLIANPDALIRGTRERPIGILEGKTLSSNQFRKVVDHGLFAHHQLQMQNYMLVCDLSWAAIAILSPDQWQFTINLVEANPGVQKTIVEVCEVFWFQYVQTDTPPPGDITKWQIELPEVGGRVMTRKDEDFLDAVTRAIGARDMLKEAKELDGTAKSKLKEVCGLPGVYEGGSTRVYFRQNPGKSSFDEKKLAAAGLLDPLKLQTDLLQRFDVSMADLEQIGNNARIDLKDYAKQGEPFESIRLYHVKDQE